MALKGSMKVLGSKLVAPDAYVVVDQMYIFKGGMANAHVSVYATPPETVKVAQTKMEGGVEVEVMVDQTDRGPVIEHFTFGGIDVKGKDPIVAAYEQGPSLDERLAGLSNA